MSFHALYAFFCVVLCGLGCSLLVTPLVRGIARKLGLVDQPGPRRIHLQPVPRLGGISVFLGFHLGAAALLLPSWGFASGVSTIDLSWWIRFLPVSGFVLVVGLVDDIFGLKPLAKLALQVVAAVLLYCVEIHAGTLLGLELPGWLDLCISVAWVLAFVNAFNLIDGLDGLASGLGAIAALGLTFAFLLRDMPVEAGLMLAFCASCMGFLRYNFHPASIFLGDSGSMFLGFTIAAIALTASSKGALMAAIGVPLLAVGVPIFDTMLAVWRRSIRSALPQSNVVARPRIMKFDLEHVHHRLLQAGLNQRKVAWLLYTVNGLLVTLGLASMIFKDQAWGIFVLASMIALYVVVKHVVYVELWDSGVALLQGFRSPSNRTLATILYPVFDLFALSAAFSCALLLEHGGRFPPRFGENLAIWVGCFFIALFLSRTYSRVWSRARVSEFFVLGLSLVSSALVVQVLLEMIVPQGLHLRVVTVGMYLTLALLSLGLIRLFPRLLRELLLFSGRSRFRESQVQIAPVVVYGAGDRGALYLKHFSLQDPLRMGNERVVALVDDDLNLRGRLVFDIPVIGSIRDLARYLGQHRVKRIVLAATLSEKRKHRLRVLAEKHAVSLSEWSIEERPFPGGREVQHSKVANQ